MALDESAVSISNNTEPEGDATTSHQGTEDRYRPMFLAALKGNWKAAKKFLKDDPAAATARITRNSMTALHVAAGEGHHEFVERIISLISGDDLKLQDGAGYTALHHAAIAGSVRASAALVKKNRDLTNVLDLKGQTPLLLASRFVYGNYDVLWYLTMVTDDEPGSPFTGTAAMDLVLMLVLSGSLDILLYLLERNDGLATATTAGGASLLSLLAVTPSNFLSGTKFGFWESVIYSVIPTRKSYEAPDYVRSIVEESRAGVSQQYPVNCTKLVHQVLQLPRRYFFAAIRYLTPTYIKRLQRAKHKHHCAVKLFKHACAKISENGSLTDYFINKGGILYQATSLGIIEILEIMFQLCPDLMWVSPEDEKFPIHIAVENRRENIFKLLCKKNARNKIQSDQVTTSGTTIMHYAAKLAPFEQLSAVSGAALQMQQEMKWFKEAEKLVHPYFRTKKNGEGKTPRELFSEEHKALAEAGEKWMKDTSNSCMIVSTLIATVVFAAAFKVPGGNKSETGIPIFLWTNAFLVFAVSDALALFSSLTSVLMFLSIMTARYAEEDFMESLPKRLVIGLASLFLAITTVMVSFGATLSIVLEERLKWIVAPTVCLSCVPVGLFTFLQLPLFIKMVRLTFGSGFRPERTR